MVEEYAKKWKGHGDFLCISDHGMMAAIPRQIKACEPSGKKDDPHKDKKLTPIFGCELYTNPMQVEYDTEDELQQYIKSLNPQELKVMRRKGYHLLAIAHNDIGYSNLVRLTSLAWTKGFYYRPRVNHEQLVRHKEGIFFTSCCYASEIAQAFEHGGEEAGFQMVEKYLEMFGENFFFELMLLDFEKQKPYDKFIIKCHEKYGRPLIISNDCHFCNEEDSHYQHLSLMVQTGNTIHDIQRKLAEDSTQDLFELQERNLWMKIEREINEKWKKDYSHIIDYDLFKQAKLNTVELARRAKNVNIDRSMKLPKLPDADAKLREEAEKGLKKRCLNNSPKYRKRLEEECELITRKDFSSYFLIEKAMVDEAREAFPKLMGWGDGSHAVGPGRGCLGSNVYILMSNGRFKKIKDIVVGDYVISSDGKAHLVEQIHQYACDEKLLNIKTYYGDNMGVQLTKDHHVLVEKAVRPDNYDNWSDTTKKSRRNFLEPTGDLKWIEASEVQVGDWVFIPFPKVQKTEKPKVLDLAIFCNLNENVWNDDVFVYEDWHNPLTGGLRNRKKIKRYIQLDDDWFVIIGRFAGDGWFCKDKKRFSIGFAFNSSDREGIDFVKNKFTSYGVPTAERKHKSKNLVQVLVYSKCITCLFRKWFNQYKSEPSSKHIPSFIFKQNKRSRYKFLKGYMLSDGHQGKHKYSFDTVSYTLAFQTRYLCLQMGIPMSLNFYTRKDKRNGVVTNGVKMNIPKNGKIGTFWADKKYTYRLIEDGFLFKVRIVEEIENEEAFVYDISVRDVSNYLTSSFVVHNSAVGSLLCYCLGITNVDPIRHGLLFSRFLSEARGGKSMQLRFKNAEIVH